MREERCGEDAEVVIGGGWRDDEVGRGMEMRWRWDVRNCRARLVHDAGAAIHAQLLKDDSISGR